MSRFPSSSSEDFILFILVGCVGLLIAVPIVMFIWAVILRLSCTICGAKSPGFLRAAGTFLVIFLLNGAVNLVLALIFGVLVQSDDPSTPRKEELTFAILRLCIGMPINMLISATVFSGMLEGVSFLKGILIWLCQTILLALLTAFFVAVGIATHLAMNGIK